MAIAKRQAEPRVVTDRDPALDANAPGLHVPALPAPVGRYRMICSTSAQVGQPLLKPVHHVLQAVDHAHPAFRVSRPVLSSRTIALCRLSFDQVAQGTQDAKVHHADEEQAHADVLEEALPPAAEGNAGHDQAGSCGDDESEYEGS